MSKLPFSKLKLTKKEDIKTITINEQEIKVKQYLPVADKLELIANTLNNAADDNNFSNPVKLDVFGTLEIIYAYTNLSFTEKQKEDPAKLFDLLETNGVIDAIIKEIPEIEYKNLIAAIEETSDAFYKYHNSVLGILEQVSADYSALDFDATNIQKKLADGENVEFLKDVMTKLG